MPSEQYDGFDLSPAERGEVTFEELAVARANTITRLESLLEQRRKEHESLPTPSNSLTTSVLNNRTRTRDLPAAELYGGTRSEQLLNG